MSDPQNSGQNPASNSSPTTGPNAGPNSGPSASLNANRDASLNANLDELVRRIKAFSDPRPSNEPTHNGHFAPEQRLEARPESRTESRPEPRFEAQPESRQNYRPEIRPDFPPQSRPDSNSDYRPAFRPESSEYRTDPYRADAPSGSPATNLRSPHPYEPLEDIRISPLPPPPQHFSPPQQLPPAQQFPVSNNGLYPPQYPDRTATQTYQPAPSQPLSPQPSTPQPARSTSTQPYTDYGPPSHPIQPGSIPGRSAEQQPYAASPAAPFAPTYAPQNPVPAPNRPGSTNGATNGASASSPQDQSGYNSASWTPGYPSPYAPDAASNAAQSANAAYWSNQAPAPNVTGNSAGNSANGSANGSPNSSNPSEHAPHQPVAASPAQPSPNTPIDPNAQTGFQRAVNAVRSAIPLVQRLLPLLDGNFTTAINALVAAPQSTSTPQHTSPAPAVRVDLEPVERGLAEVRNSNRELRTQVLEQITTFKRVEDQLERVREATDRNTLEQQELVEDLRSVGTRVSTFAIIGLVLLVLLVAVNVFFLVQLQHILR